MNYSGFSSLTGSYSTVLSLTDTASSTTKYTANTITVQAYVSGASLYFSVNYNDAHVASGAGPDSVSAGAGYYVYVTSASGAFTGYTILNSSATTGAF